MGKRRQPSAQLLGLLFVFPRYAEWFKSSDLHRTGFEAGRDGEIQAEASWTHRQTRLDVVINIQFMWHYGQRGWQRSTESDREHILTKQENTNKYHCE